MLGDPTGLEQPNCTADLSDNLLDAFAARSAGADADAGADAEEAEAARWPPPVAPSNAAMAKVAARTSELRRRASVVGLWRATRFRLVMS